MNLVKIAEERVSLLFKKSEGKATRSDLKKLNKLANLMRKTKASLTISEEDKRFLQYAKRMITALENKAINVDPTTSSLVDLDFTRTPITSVSLDLTKIRQIPT